MVNKREKESDRETSDSKKHRKANFSNSTEVPTKTAKVDIHSCEEESKKRSTDKDTELFIQTCENLETLLPQPLYVAYVNLSSYSNITKKIIDVKIVGDEKEAKELRNTDKIDNKDEKNGDESDDTGDDNDDDDNDEIENDSAHSSKKHHRRHQLSSVTTEINIYKPHPLSITFKLQTATVKGPTLSITLFYLPALNFVTVQSKLIDFETEGVAARDFLDPTKILNCLVPSESDENELLQPKTKYRLHHLSLDPATFFMKLGENQLGKPFTWAQNVCGLNFISKTESAQETVPMIIDKMHTRLESRHQLYRQVLALEQQFYESGSKNVGSNSCILTQWSPITFAEYSEQVPVTGRFIDKNLVTSNHLLYNAVLIRGSAKMECFVSVSPNFPDECPIWAITLNLNGSRLHPSNTNDIKEMESEINSIESFEKNVSNVLILQLEHAMSSLNIFIETEQIRLASSSSVSAKVKVFRGRIRSRAYEATSESTRTIDLIDETDTGSINLLTATTSETKWVEFLPQFETKYYKYGQVLNTVPSPMGYMLKHIIYVINDNGIRRADMKSEVISSGHYRDTSQPTLLPCPSSTCIESSDNFESLLAHINNQNHFPPQQQQQH